MDYVTYGRTGLKVSVAGMGCGGFSRLGLSQGKSESEAADVVRSALDLGINYIDTADSYQTEGAVGQAIRGRDRNQIVVSTKGRIGQGGELFSGQTMLEKVDASLRTLGTDYIDIYMLHAPHPDMHDHIVDVVLPALVRAREAGKLRFIGLTELGSDHDHEAISRAVEHPDVHAAMVAFHLMHQTARKGLFGKLQSLGIGTSIMYAVRNIFARQEVLRDAVAQLVDLGELPAELAGKSNPLDFLIHEGGAESVTEAAYRYARHQPWVHSVVFGTGNIDHVKSNVAALLKPPLPDGDVRAIERIFGHLVGVGIEKTPRGSAMDKALAKSRSA